MCLDCHDPKFCCVLCSLCPPQMPAATDSQYGSPNNRPTRGRRARSPCTKFLVSEHALVWRNEWRMRLRHFGPASSEFSDSLCSVCRRVLTVREQTLRWWAWCRRRRWRGPPSLSSTGIPYFSECGRSVVAEGRRREEVFAGKAGGTGTGAGNAEGEAGQLRVLHSRDRDRDGQLGRLRDG